MQGDETLKLLAAAWDSYLKEYGSNESPASWLHDDTNDFRKVIHEGERIITSKQLRALRPEKFRT